MNVQRASLMNVRVEVSPTQFSVQPRSMSHWLQGRPGTSEPGRRSRRGLVGTQCPARLPGLHDPVPCALDIHYQSIHAVDGIALNIDVMRAVVPCGANSGARGEYRCFGGSRLASPGMRTPDSSVLVRRPPPATVHTVSRPFWRLLSIPARPSLGSVDLAGIRGLRYL